MSKKISIFETEKTVDDAGNPLVGLAKEANVFSVKRLFFCQRDFFRVD